METIQGVIIHVSYVARKPEHDRVTVMTPTGKQVACYRFQVKEDREGEGVRLLP